MIWGVNWGLSKKKRVKKRLSESELYRLLLIEKFDMMMAAKDLERRRSSKVSEYIK